MIDNINILKTCNFYYHLSLFNIIYRNSSNFSINTKIFTNIINIKKNIYKIALIKK